MYEFHDLPKAIFDASQKCAISGPKYKYMKEMKSITLAKIMSKYEGNQASKEQQALCDPEYEQFILNLQTAEEEMLKDRAHLVARTAELDVARSIQATRREEMKLI